MRPPALHDHGDQPRARARRRPSRRDGAAGLDHLRPDTLSFEREDESKSLSVTVTPPAGSGPVGTSSRPPRSGEAASAGDGALVLIDYPHIRPGAVVHASTAELRAARISLPPLTRSATCRGASDRVPEALQAVGVPIGAARSRHARPRRSPRYDAIVIGSRAYGTEPALVASNGRLLDYVRAGGLMIVQYQQYPFVNRRLSRLPPLDRAPARRVTDETGARHGAGSASSAFHSPNDIGRRLAEAGCRSADCISRTIGIPPTRRCSRCAILVSRLSRAGLLVARWQRARTCTTGLSFFRQLPAWSPGRIGCLRISLRWHR